MNSNPRIDPSRTLAQLTPRPGQRAALADEVARQSPTAPPLPAADAPSLPVAVGFVVGLLGLAGALAWTVAPIL